MYITICICIHTYTCIMIYPTDKGYMLKKLLQQSLLKSCDTIIWKNSALDCLSSCSNFHYLPSACLQAIKTLISWFSCQMTSVGCGACVMGMNGSAWQKQKTHSGNFERFYGLQINPHPLHTKSIKFPDFTPNVTSAVERYCSMFHLGLCNRDLISRKAGSTSSWIIDGKWWLY